MRYVEALKVFAGSVVVYYVMAACSASSSSPVPGGGPQNGGGPSSPSASGSGSGSGGVGSGSGASSGSGSGATSSGGSGSGSSGSSPVPDANADTTQSGSRLKAAYYVGGDGSKQFQGWQDSARNNEGCSFSAAADGATRCLPTSTAYAQSYYSDAGCSHHVAYMTGVCSATPTYALAYDTGSCATRVHVYTVDGPFTGTLYVGTPGSCVATTPTSTFSYFAVGAEVPASSFQSATIQVE